MSNPPSSDERKPANGCLRFRANLHDSVGSTLPSSAAALETFRSSSSHANSQTLQVSVRQTKQRHLKLVRAYQAPSKSYTNTSPIPPGPRGALGSSLASASDASSTLGTQALRPLEQLQTGGDSPIPRTEPLWSFAAPTLRGLTPLKHWVPEPPEPIVTPHEEDSVNAPGSHWAPDTNVFVLACGIGKARTSLHMTSTGPCHSDSFQVNMPRLCDS